MSVVLSGMVKNTNIYLHCEQHLEESQVPSTLLHFDHPCLRIHRLSAESSHLYMDQTLSLILITDQNFYPHCYCQKFLLLVFSTRYYGEVL